MATQASLTIWAKQWLATADAHTNEAVWQTSIATDKSIPMHARRRAKELAQSARRMASECMAHAADGTRY